MSLSDSTAQMLSKYVEAYITSIRNEANTEIYERITNIVGLVKYLRNLDSFIFYYQRSLAGRLIKKTSGSQEAEETFV